MEALQLAQMLADLNDMRAVQDQEAAKALVTANKDLGHKSATASHQEYVTDKSTSDSRVTSAPKRLDGLGRIFTPPLSRTNSGTPSSSIPGTPKREEGDDLDRASTLMTLYELRAKLKEQDNTALIKAREKINALAAKQNLASRDAKAHPATHGRTTSQISFPK